MIKKLTIFLLIGLFLLSGCAEIKELYGIQPSAEGQHGEEYIPIEEIRIEEMNELPPSPVEAETPKAGEIAEEPEEETEVIAEEPEEEKAETKKEAKVIIVKETDLVSLKPKATDPDGDVLTFTYTSPLDATGKWKTTYGNAGEYTVTITASDGRLSSTKDVLIIVNKKEEAPVIDEALPEKGELNADEDSTLEFMVKASDLNNDPLAYSWKLDGSEVSADDSYTYNIGYDDAGQHTVKILVSDGVKEASRIWAVKVNNVNREPILEKIKDISVKETGTIVLEPRAADPDDDDVTFSVDSSRFRKVDGRFEWKTTYDDAGEYTVTITASDGEDDTIQKISITIENVNREPVIEDIILG
ncbi:hypothetical protein KY366_02440 [Candidatus Woesearchaeota archaeon]|nr:hypothetical protein [Candidatus Woesearchaeota archaeon]